MVLFSKLKALIIPLIEKNTFETPFGTIKSEVSLFPVIYLFIVHLSGLLPWEIWNGQTLYKLWSQSEYLAEHFQFVLYFSASLLSAVNIFKSKYKLFSIQNISWMILFVSLLIISFEEVSFLIPYKD